ncbi:MAG TPA: GreA/GreB family elongation factor [Verrucomicrobiae bacterium]|nr:GreA/GreB family elongation factor [Verrucomicrobiae bacterium]
MSKAFTKESDLEKEEPQRSPRPSVPAGVTNYITAAGAKRLADELTRLSQRKQELRTAATPAARSEMGDIDYRRKQVQEILSSTVVAKPPAKGREKVRFGATVVVNRGNGERKTYQIVGVDEAEPEEGCISWLSPLAQQLMLRKAGDQISFSSPEGVESMQILSVAYDDPSVNR